MKSERERQIPYDITYMWNLKYYTDDSIYKIETDLQTQRRDSWLPRGRELWYRSQMRLRSHIAVAVVQASNCSYDLTPSLGTSICQWCGLGGGGGQEINNQINIILSAPIPPPPHTYIFKYSAFVSQEYSSKDNLWKFFLGKPHSFSNLLVQFQ